MVFIWFCYRVNANLIKYVGKLSVLFYVVEKIV